jgi:hypothetical protein
VSEVGVVMIVEKLTAVVGLIQTRSLRIENLSSLRHVDGEAVGSDHGI